MNANNEKIDLISEGHLYFLRNISIDNVIFSYHNEELKVLLYFNTFKEWSLTGGFISRKETLDEAANRIARRPTGLDTIFMKQFKAFGGPERRNFDHYFDNNNESIRNELLPKDSWLNDYFVTIGYYSLIEYKKTKIENDYAKKCRWWNVYDLPPLMIDHKEIIESALHTLRQDLDSTPIAKEVLPEKFTNREIQTLYETVQGKGIDRRNFYKKMKSSGWLIQLDEKKDIGAHKSPYLYMFYPDL